jgi:hypothetical protein
MSPWVSEVVTVNPPPLPVVSVNATDPPYGGLTTVTWSSSGAVSCTREEGTGTWPTAPDAAALQNAAGLTYGPLGISVPFTVSCKNVVGGVGSGRDTANVPLPPASETTSSEALVRIGDYYGQTLWARVMVWRDADLSGDYTDGTDIGGDFSAGESFTTLDHYPDPQISIDPAPPVAGRASLFTDAGDCHSGTCVWSWDFGNGDTSPGRSVSYEYPDSLEGAVIELSATNAAGTCTDTQTLDIGKAIPIFKEVAPQ